MNSRSSLALIALILIAGAIALWWSDRQQQPVDLPAKPVGSAEMPLPTASGAFDGAYVLAISWHPAFCETKPYLPECRSEKNSDSSANSFSLHGLWPQQGEYCGVPDHLVGIDASNRWDDLPEIEVSGRTWRDLVRIMPGTEDSLERHEWLLHGTCAGATADIYFSRAIALVDEVNASQVRDLLARNAGARVSRTQIRAAFDAAFGDDSGRKVRVDCEDDDDRTLIFELRVNLDGNAMAGASLRDLIRSARNASAGCSGGIVDLAGDQ